MSSLTESDDACLSPKVSQILPKCAHKYKVSKILPKCTHKYKKSALKYKVSKNLPKCAHKYKVSQFLHKCAHKYKKNAHTSKVSQILPTGAHKYATNSCGNKKQEINSSKKSSSTIKMDESKSNNYAIPALGVKSPSFSSIDI